MLSSGWPFDQAKADRYYAEVTKKVAKLVIDTRKRWDDAGL